MPALEKTLTPEQINQALYYAYHTYKDVDKGKNASYIPYLASVPSDLFGIAFATHDAQIYRIGDTDYAFAIESLSKLFTLGYVLDQIGSKQLRRKIGASPTGEPFNSVMALELHRERPLNPFVNAGAMATTSLIAGTSVSERWDCIMSVMNSYAGRSLTLNDEVYKSESATNQHNRGIAWLLDSSGYMYSDPMEACDLYTRQCSVNITTVDLALMGATLANKGVNPYTGTRALMAKHVPNVLAEMTMNGLYDGTGDWQYEVGLPAKSGVGGGILAVVPGMYAIAAFSPPLDRHGNSVRAQKAIKYLSEHLGLNLFDAGE